MKYDSMKSFVLQGVISETSLVEEKTRLEHSLSIQMRDNGYVDVLDLDPDWVLDYDLEVNSYRFTLTMYGVECDEPWRYGGLLNGKMILKSTASNK